MHIDSLQLYPIKSTAAVNVPNAVVEARGLAGDRRFMLVDDQGRFMTGRQYPDLVLVRAQITATGLRIDAPGMESIRVVEPDSRADTVTVNIWHDETTARAVDPSVDRWFTDYLGHTCRLVFQHHNDVRPVAPADGTNDDDRVSFADGYPLLLIGTASLDDLNGRLASPVAMGRFRTNLVAATTAAFVEDTWRRIRVGEVTFDVVKRCARCVFTTVDPLSGQRDVQGEPLKTLRGYRLDKDARGIMFGVNLVARSPGQLSRGMPIKVITKLD